MLIIGGFIVYQFSVLYVLEVYSGVSFCLAVGDGHVVNSEVDAGVSDFDSVVIGGVDLQVSDDIGVIFGSVSFPVISERYLHKFLISVDDISRQDIYDDGV